MVSPEEWDLLKLLHKLPDNAVITPLRLRVKKIVYQENNRLFFNTRPYSSSAQYVLSCIQKSLEEDHFKVHKNIDVIVRGDNILLSQLMDIMPDDFANCIASIEFYKKNKNQNNIGDKYHSDRKNRFEKVDTMIMGSALKPRGIRIRLINPCFLARKVFYECIHLTIPAPEPVPVNRVSKIANDFNQHIRKALDYLKKINHPIAQTTYQIIQKKRVIVSPISNVIKEHFGVLIRFANKKLKEVLPEIFPPSKETIEKIESTVHGFFSGHSVFCLDSIYLRSLKPDDTPTTAETLVHEVNHYLNQSHLKKGEDALFTEELRARLVEDMIYNKRITWQYLEGLAKSVARDYDYCLPKHIDYPDGIFHEVKGAKMRAWVE